MLCRILKRMIEIGNVDGLMDKLDIFLTANKLTKEEYTELRDMLGKSNTK